MSMARPMNYTMAWLAASGLCLPAPALAADPAPRPAVTTTQASSPVSDVALGPGGLLTGQLLDANLRPAPDVSVAIQCDEQTIATTHSDANGVFAVAGLRGGIHRITTPEASQVYRFWATGTAPPRAATSAQVVSGTEIVRGQWGGHTPYLHQAAMMATNPFLVAAVVATAVAIPVVIHNVNNDHPPNS
jgi:hypothetical protein